MPRKTGILESTQVRRFERGTYLTYKIVGPKHSTFKLTFIIAHLHYVNSSRLLSRHTQIMAPLEAFTSSSSVKGLSSVTTLVVGATSALVFDPPFLVPDGEAVVAWIKKTTKLPVKAVFVTHHHPDHFFAANAVLEAYPEAKFYAAPYVRDGIDREYEEKVVFWPSVFGKENIYATPRKPEPFPHSLIRLEGNPESPIFLLGPLQGDSVDHTLFWLPQEKILIAGDAVYARSTHVW